MFQTFRNAWKIEDLRKKIIFTILILIVYRLGAAIPAPFIDASVISEKLSDAGTIFGFFNMLSGGGFSQATLFALGVTPYINASIIIQLLGIVIPALERMSKEGEEGRRKLNKISRYAAIGISLILSFVYYILMKNQNALVYTEGFAGMFSAIIIVASFTAGAVLVVWLGEQIDSSGIGNGISLLIFVGILGNITTAVQQVIYYFNVAKTGSYTVGTAVDGSTTIVPVSLKWYYIAIPLILIMFAVMFVLIVAANSAERRIPVQYAKRVVGRKVYGGQSSNLPIKVTMTGVLPVIFASAILSVPGTIKDFFGITEGIWGKFLGFFSNQGWGYIVLYALFILGFNYFYVAVQYNPVQMSNDLRKNSGMIPGIRPGKPTSDLIAKVISKVTFIGALFLILVATMPIIITRATGINISLGGTSVLILVGVALEVSTTLESYMLMRHYKGFLE